MLLQVQGGSPDLVQILNEAGLYLTNQAKLMVNYFRKLVRNFVAAEQVFGPPRQRTTYVFEKWLQSVWSKMLT